MENSHLKSEGTLRTVVLHNTHFLPDRVLMSMASFVYPSLGSECGRNQNRKWNRSGDRSCNNYITIIINLYYAGISKPTYCTKEHHNVLTGKITGNFKIGERHD